MDFVILLAGIALILVVLALLAQWGLRMKPWAFPPFPQEAPAPKRVPLPAGLPAPVERYYRAIYGETVPVITSAVITGRATFRRGPLTFNGRFRITHDAGQAYRHYIEATFFGFTVMQINERYVDGKSRMEIGRQVTENEPKVNQGANLGLWAESIWLPAIFITDLRVRWKSVDDDTAILFVPFESGYEHFVARFDPQTGLLRYLEAMRYKAYNSPAKTLWIDEAVQWDTSGEQAILTIGAATWFDEGRPWAVFHTEEVVYNADVKEYIHGRGL